MLDWQIVLLSCPCTQDTAVTPVMLTTSASQHNRRTSCAGLQLQGQRCPHLRPLMLNNIDGQATASKITQGRRSGACLLQLLLLQSYRPPSLHLHACTILAILQAGMQVAQNSAHVPTSRPNSLSWPWCNHCVQNRRSLLTETDFIPGRTAQKAMLILFNSKNLRSGELTSSYTKGPCNCSSSCCSCH